MIVVRFIVMENYDPFIVLDFLSFFVLFSVHKYFCFDSASIDTLFGEALLGECEAI